MQDKFVGDIGDYAKYALLRAVVGERQLGLAWYLHPDRGVGGDHIEYLQNPHVWRPVDCDLFDSLQAIIAEWRDGHPRAVVQIEDLNLLPRAIFARERLTYPPGVAPTRDQWRRDWFGRVMNNRADCNMVFVDPDNGLCLPANFDARGNDNSWQRPLNEAIQLCDGRPAIIYHHNSRFQGGHRAEIQYWMALLPGCTHAFYMRRWGNRTFFVVNFDQNMLRHLNAFVANWQAAERRARIRPANLSELISNRNP